jgi:hypothetical protein
MTGAIKMWQRGLLMKYDGGEDYSDGHELTRPSC